MAGQSGQSAGGDFSTAVICRKGMAGQSELGAGDDFGLAGEVKE